MITDVGDFELRVPRDRNGTFGPQTVPKHQRRLDGLTGNVISLHAKGMTIGDIHAHLLEIVAHPARRHPPGMPAR